MSQNLRTATTMRLGSLLLSTGDEALKCLVSSQIPDTETKRDPQNSAVPRGFEGSSHVGRWRADWLAGAAGFETLHSE